MRDKRTRVRVALVAAAAAVALTLATPLAAQAVTGSHGCAVPSKYGWLATNTTGSTINKPPGSQVAYSFTVGGSYSRVAIYSATLLPKPYGGAWEAKGTTLSSATPSCQTYG